MQLTAKASADSDVGQPVMPQNWSSQLFNNSDKCIDLTKKYKPVTFFNSDYAPPAGVAYRGSMDFTKLAFCQGVQLLLGPSGDNDQRCLGDMSICVIDGIRIICQEFGTDKNTNRVSN